MAYRVGIITLSDKGAKGEREDKSGPVIAQIMERAGYEIDEMLLIPDERAVLEQELIRLADEKDAALILTTGGTGFSRRDQTPEATLAVATRDAPGIAEAIRYGSMQITKRAMLGRGVSVIRNQTLIINLPGSPKAVRESLDFVLGELEHGIRILRGDEGECGAKTYRGVIFDLDGTLLDTIADLSESVNAVMRGYGFPEHTYEAYKLKIGNGIRNLVRRSLPGEAVTDELVDEALAKFAAVYDREYLRRTKPYPGIPELLQYLQEKGIKIGVNSNKRSDYSEMMIRKFFPDITFTDIIGEREGRKRKPDPEAALEIAGKMQLKPDEVLYVGDSMVDMQTGTNAGMGKVGVLWGFRDEEELRENGADDVADSTEYLKKYF